MTILFYENKQMTKNLIKLYNYISEDGSYLYEMHGVNMFY
jgi:hypothetical protein